jgi:copper transport protein
MGRLAVNRILAAALVIMVLCVPVVDAHAVLARSEPMPGQRIAAAPTEAWIEFNEEVEPTQTRLAVYTKVNRTQVSDPNTLETSSTGARIALIPGLGEGTYVAEWQALSTVDGHTSSGAWAFGVGEGAVIEPPASTQLAIPWASAAAKSLSFVGLALMGGFFAYRFWILGAPAPSWATRTAILGALLHASGLLALLVFEAGNAKMGLSQYLGATSFGRGLAVRLLLAAALPFALRFDARAPQGRRVIAPITFVAALAMGAFYSHAAAVSPLRILGTLVDGFHVAAAVAWAGGLLYLFRTLASTDTPIAASVHASRRFSLLAQASVAILAVTGVLMGLAIVGMPDASFFAAWQDPYRFVLLYKVGLAFLMIGLGAVNHFAFIRRLHQPGVSSSYLFRANVRREFLNGLLILLLAGLLTTLAPS